MKLIHYRHRRIICICLLVLLCGFSLLVQAAGEDEFPGRKLYPRVEVIELDDLAARLDSVQVVDVRSAHEFATLHLAGAINIPLSDADFVQRLAGLRADNVKDIVVYCNGKTCMKSYKAAKKAGEAGITGVLAFDAGIMDWARSHPDQAILLGKVLGDPARLIGKERFRKHLLSPEAFAERVVSTNAYVLDVRDRFQRDSLGLFPGRERRVHLDDRKKLDRYLDRALREKRELLFYDAAGKQVRWLQYYLEKKGVKKYHFMDGGARAYYRELTEDFLGGSAGR